MPDELESYLDPLPTPKTGYKPDEALDLIAKYESGDKNVPNYRYDTGHTAQGHYQITNTNWRNLAPQVGIDLKQYPNAMAAPKEVQATVAKTLYGRRGFADWAPFNPSLKAAITRGERPVGAPTRQRPAANVDNYLDPPQRRVAVPTAIDELAATAAQMNPATQTPDIEAPTPVALATTQPQVSGRAITGADLAWHLGADPTEFKNWTRKTQRRALQVVQEAVAEDERKKAAGQTIAPPPLSYQNQMRQKAGMPVIDRAVNFDPNKVKTPVEINAKPFTFGQNDRREQLITAELNRLNQGVQDPRRMLRREAVEGHVDEMLAQQEKAAAAHDTDTHSTIANLTAEFLDAVDKGGPWPGPTNVVRSISEAVGGTVKQVGRMQQASSLVNPIAGPIGNALVGVGQQIQTGAEMQAERSTPAAQNILNQTLAPGRTRSTFETILGTKPGVSRTLQQAAGSAAVEIPKFMLGGEILKAAELPSGALLPTLGALSRADEGLPGIIKGAGMGLVYHYGGALTGPYIGKVGNSLLWIGAPAAEAHLVNGVPWDKAIAESLPMGAFAGFTGSNRVNVRDASRPEGYRPARLRDIRRIQQDPSLVVPPVDVRVRPNEGPIQLPEGRPLVPETADTIAAQIDAMVNRRGNRLGVVIPQGQAGPSKIPKGYTATRTEAGLVIHPAEIGAEAIRSIVSEGETYRLLGHPNLDGPEASRVVVARAGREFTANGRLVKAGTELATSYVEPGNESAAIEELRQQYAPAKPYFEVGGEETAAQAVNERTENVTQNEAQPNVPAQPETTEPTQDTMSEALDQSRAIPAKDKFQALSNRDIETYIENATKEGQKRLARLEAKPPKGTRREVREALPRRIERQRTRNESRIAEAQAELERRRAGTDKAPSFEEWLQTEAGGKAGGVQPETLSPTERQELQARYDEQYYPRPHHITRQNRRQGRLAPGIKPLPTEAIAEKPPIIEAAKSGNAEPDTVFPAIEPTGDKLFETAPIKPEPEPKAAVPQPTRKGKGTIEYGRKSVEYQRKQAIEEAARILTSAETPRLRGEPVPREAQIKTAIERANAARLEALNLGIDSATERTAIAKEIPEFTLDGLRAEIDARAKELRGSEPTEQVKPETTEAYRPQQGESVTWQDGDKTRTGKIEKIMPSGRVKVRVSGKTDTARRITLPVTTEFQPHTPVVKAQAHVTGRPKLDPTKDSLERAIRAGGGIKDDGTGELRKLKESGNVGLVTPDGKPPEEMTQWLREHGYGANTFANEQHGKGIDAPGMIEAAIEDAAGSRKHYSTQYEQDFSKAEEDHWLGQMEPQEREQWQASQKFLESAKVKRLLGDIADGKATEKTTSALKGIGKQRGLSQDDIDWHIRFAEESRGEAPESVRETPDQPATAADQGRALTEPVIESTLSRVRSDIRTEAGRTAAGKRVVDQVRKDLAEDISLTDSEKIELERLTARTESAPKAGIPAYGAENKIITRERAVAAKARLKEKISGNQLHDITDFVSALPDLAELGAFHVEAGARSFAKWSRQFLKEFSEKDRKVIEPRLQEIYAKSLDVAKNASTADRVLRQLNKSRGKELKASIPRRSEQPAESATSPATKTEPARMDTDEKAGGSAKLPPPTRHVPGERSFPKTLEQAGFNGGTDRGYEVITDAAATDRAEREIAKVGANKAQALIREAGEPTKHEGTMGVLLIDQFTKSGKLDQALEVSNDLSRKFTTAGQLIQSASQIKRYSPADVLIQAQREMTGGRELTLKIVKPLLAKGESASAAERKLAEVERQHPYVFFDDGSVKPYRVARMEAEKAQNAPQEKRDSGAKPVTRKQARERIGKLQDRLASMEQAARDRIANRSAEAKATRESGVEYRHAGIPLDAKAIADYAIIGAAKLARKGIDRATWLAEMAKEIGVGTIGRDDLRKLYRESYREYERQRQQFAQERKERSAQRQATDEFRDVNKPESGIGPIKPAQQGPIETLTRAEYHRIIKEREDAQKQAQKTAREFERNFRQLNRGPVQKITEAGTGLRRANLLTAVKTHIRNLTSNTIFQGTEELSRPMAALGDMAARRLKGTGIRTTTSIDIPAATRATIAAALKEGPRRFADYMLGREVLPLEGYGKQRESIENKMQLGASDTGIPLLDKYINTVFRSMEAEDAIFKVYAFRRELTDIARSQALVERQSDRSIKVRQRAKELQRSPTDAMLMEAAAYADYATFQDPNRVSGAIAAGKSWLGPIGKFAIEQVAPFDRTPTNILYRTFENSPLGLISAAKKFHNIGNPKGTSLSGKRIPRAEYRGLMDEITSAAFTRAEQKEFARTFGRASTGTLLSGLAMILAAKGLLIGSADYDDDKADYFRKRHQFGGGAMLKVPFTDKYVYIGDNPVGKAMGTAAAMYEQMIKKQKPTETSTDLRDRKITGAAKAVGRLALDQPLLQGTRELFGNKSLSESAGNYVSSFIPGSSALTAIGEAVDPEARRTYGEGFTAQIKKVLPMPKRYGRQSLKVNAGVNKEERGHLTRRMLRALDPFNTTTAGKGPVTSRARR